MRHFFSVVQTPLGVAVSGASIDVYNAGGTVHATIYSDDGLTTTGNPLTSASDGTFGFYVADGRYDLKVSGTGITTRTFADVEIFDATEKNAADGTLTATAANFTTLTVTGSSTIGSSSIGTLTVTGNANLDGGGKFGGVWNKFDPTTNSILQLEDLGTRDNQLIGFGVEQFCNPTTSPASYFNFGQVTELDIPSSNAVVFTGQQTGSYGSFSHFGSGALNTGSGGGFEGFNPGPATATLIAGVQATANNGGVATGVPLPEQFPTNNGNTANARAFDGQAKNLSSGTLTNGAAFYAEAPINSGGGTFTNAYGLFVADMTAATNNFAIKTGVGKVSIGDAATFNSTVQASTLGVGAAPLTLSGVLVNNSNLAGIVQIGILSAPVCSSAATVEGEGGRFRVDTAAASFTMALAQALHVVEGNKGAGSIITTEVGLDVDTLSNGSTNIAVRTGANPCQWGGLFTKYNNISTVSGGIPAEYATVDSTGLTAAVGTTTLYAVPASGAGQYRLCWNAKVTSVGTTSTLGPLTLIWTDPDGVTITTVIAGTQAGGSLTTAGLATNTTSTFLLGTPVMLNVKASTNIQYSFAYASTGSAMQYNLHLKLEAM